MYVAKASDDAVALYHPEMASGRAERLALVADLRLALDHTPEQFALCYQPKIDLATGEVVSAEALVRWMHPTRGTVTPDRFIPLAEATGLVDKLTRHLLSVALADCSRWRSAGYPIGVAVNLSPRNLAQDTIVEQVNSALLAAKVSPAWLCLEITETVMMQDGNRAVRILGELAALGVEISLDDFGTGYSSLAYLQRLPVHELKIDKSFVAGLCDDESANAPALFRSITALAGNLSLRVVAEGIETTEQLAAVTALGCDIGQGYLISRPLPLLAFLDWLHDRKASPSTDVHAAQQPAELRLVAVNG
jgi:EAL domain-containing protein (putative c-di-GMP-specific phosphodiesterase class I)